MALRQLVLGRDITLRTRELAGVNAELEELRGKLAAFKTREAELEAAIAEVTDETPAEETEKLDAMVNEFAEEMKPVEEAAAEKERAAVNLQAEIDRLQGELDAINEKTRAEEKPAPTEPEKRSEKIMITREFFGMNAETRDAFFAREDVKDFVTRVRTLATEKRAVTGGELLIPEVMLPLLREQVENTSKLLKYVNRQSVPGKARQRIMGAIPEAVWTEMCATLNELSLSFNDAEVDGYKVGGYIAVCNALIEDNDVNLVSHLIFALGRAIALALDKAILYGTGTKMPTGIVTRLVQTAAPADYPATARTWVDLHTSNVKSITAANSTGIKLFQSIVAAFGNAHQLYAAGGKFWAMNNKTHMELVAQAMAFNSAAAIVSGVNTQMPVIGGDIVELDFIPDNVIVAGYGEGYLLAERAGTSIASSEHYRFVEDQTVFKGTARYDGKPVIAEGFVAIGINAVTPTASMTFAPDSANTVAESTGDGENH